MELEYHLESIDAAAKELLSAGSGHNVWAFDGEMASGKTTLIHAVCRHLAAEGSFGSPTFSIINEYGSSRGIIYHIDLYRCKNEDEAIRAGVEDCLYSGSFCLVEWPSRAISIFPPDTLRLKITVTGENSRHIKVTFPAASHETQAVNGM
jgi:tRNA threonylcarbamoyladenosine biosynthesis protein TsaE